MFETRFCAVLRLRKGSAEISALLTPLRDHDEYLALPLGELRERLRSLGSLGGEEAHHPPGGAGTKDDLAVRDGLDSPQYLVRVGPPSRWVPKHRRASRHPP